MLDKRVHILCGHYGSGKTNIAVNMAYKIKKSYDKVAIADIDIVNPYFRTKDSEEDFKKDGIRLICSEFANSNVDLPSMPSDLYSITDELDQKVVIDVGGDDRGALALGRLSKQLNQENNYEMYMVINMYRPLTRTVEDVIQVKNEIEYASNMKFTGIINNSNLGNSTTKEDVINSISFAENCSKVLSLPLVFTTVSSEIEIDGIDNLYKLKLQTKIKGE